MPKRVGEQTFRSPSEKPGGGLSASGYSAQGELVPALLAKAEPGSQSPEDRDVAAAGCHWPEQMARTARASPLMPFPKNVVAGPLRSPWPGPLASPISAELTPSVHCYYLFLPPKPSLKPPF